jgi:hypothetical protein
MKRSPLDMLVYNFLLKLGLGKPFSIEILIGNSFVSQLTAIPNCSILNRKNTL